VTEEPLAAWIRSLYSPTTQLTTPTLKMTTGMFVILLLETVLILMLTFNSSQAYI
jgi:hypothetical protein